MCVGGNDAKPGFPVEPVTRITVGPVGSIPEGKAIWGGRIMNGTVKKCCALVTVFACLLLPAVLRAQVDRGTINGTISDTSGAVIPGVRVAATNVETGVITRSVSNSVGFYSILNLPIGKYALVFDKEGFAKLERAGITLSVGQVALINETLSVGGSTAVVSVTDDAPVLNLETSDVGADVKLAALDELPLNAAGGRDIENFAFAVVPGVEGNAWTAMINGTQAFTKDVKIDGTSLTATITGDQMENGPSMEAVQEMNVQTSGLTAENSSTNGGVELFTLKSGTNELHGSAFGYGHNEILDANTWSNDNAGTPKSKSRFWDWGFSAGGPILKNRTFIFGAFEKYQQSDFTMGSLSATVPTPAFLQGDFSALLDKSTVLGTDKSGNPIYKWAIFDPGTGNVFPDNVIPSGRLSAVAQKIAAVYTKDYKPENSNLNQNERNLLGNSPVQDRKFFDVKADQVLSQKNRISGSLIMLRSPRLLADGASVWSPGTTDGGPLSDSRHQSVNTQSWRLSDSHTFSNALLNVANLTYNRYWNGNAQVESGNWPSELGFGSTGVHNFPKIAFGGSRNGVAETAIGNGWTNYYLGQTYILNDTVSWVFGRHTTKFGFEGWHQLITSDTGHGALQFNFDPNTTGAYSASYSANVGYGFASFMLGDVQSANEGVGLQQHGRRDEASWYAQDDWRVNRRLTLNLGLRWDVTTPFTEANGRWANYSTNVKNPQFGVPGLLQFADSGSKSFEGSSDYNQWGPHIGAAVQVTSKLVARASYGILYVPIGTDYWEGVPYGYAPGYRGTNLIKQKSDSSPVFNWDQGYPGVYVAPTKVTSPLDCCAVNVDPHSLQQGYTHQFNAGVEYAIGKDIRVSANYVGNRGERLHDGNLNMNESDPATFLKLVNSGHFWDWIYDAPSAAAAGVPYPYAGFGGFANAAIEPYPQVSADTYWVIYYVGTPKGKTTYDAMQLEIVKRTGQGLTMDMGYTLSRALGNTGSNFAETWGFGYFQDYTKLDQEASLPSTGDQKNILKGYVSYELPFGHGKQWLASNALADKFVGGWHVTGLLHYNSGSPIGVWASNPYGGAPYWAGVYPNVNKSGDFSSQFHKSLFNMKSGAKYFDGSNFTQPAWGTLGTGPEIVSALRGFGYADEDMTMLKYTSFGPEGKFKLSIRVEFYDLFNRHYYDNPVNDITSPLFGYVTSVGGTSRNGQFGARFQW